MGFSGDLADLPLQDILYVVSSRGKSGVLTLQTRTHDIEFVFDRGTVASVRTSDGSLKIGHLLVSEGYVTGEQVERALGLQAMNPAAERIGDLLIQVGYVTRDQIQKVVNAQLEASIFRILVQSGGTFSFDSSEPVVQDPNTEGLRLESMVLNAMRLADEWRSAHDPDTQITLADALIDSALINELPDDERTVLMTVLNGDATLDVIALRIRMTARQFKDAVERLQERGLIEVRTLEEQHASLAG